MIPIRNLPLKIEDWPQRLREEYEERAAIMEYDGHMLRASAERLAELSIRAIVMSMIMAEKHGQKSTA